MDSFISLFQKGGYSIPIILAFGFIILLIISERLFHFHRSQINIREFLNGIFNVLQQGNILEAISICDETPGPVASMIRSILHHYDQDEMEMRRAAEESGLEEISRLEQYLNLLASLTHIVMLLGLWGTVIGMITLFQDMESKGVFFDLKTMSTGVWQALLSTAVGLSIAIFSHSFYNYFISRIQIMGIDIQKASREIIYYLKQHQASIKQSTQKR